jgi:hypothetical protein
MKALAIDNRFQQCVLVMWSTFSSLGLNVNGRVFASRIKLLMAVGSRSILSGFANTHATSGFAVEEE